MKETMNREIKLNLDELKKVTGGDYIQDFQGDYGDWLVENPNGTYDQFNSSYDEWIKP